MSRRPRPHPAGLRGADDRAGSRSGSGVDGLGWNELDYLSFDRFQRMTPAVVGLEVSRLTGLIRARPPRPEARNHLVRARHELTIFLERVADARGPNAGPMDQPAADSTPASPGAPVSLDAAVTAAGTPIQDPVPLGAEREKLAEPLRAAILALSSDPSDDRRIAYALDRVTYIYHRLALIY